MPQRAEFFRGDIVVHRIHEAGNERFFTVRRTFWEDFDDDEDEDDDEEDDKDDEEELAPTPQNHIHVTDLEEEKTILAAETEFVVVDRPLEIGAIVKYMDQSLDSQSGRVIEVRVEATLRHLQTNKTISRVDCRKLDFAKPELVSMFAVKNDWIGEIIDEFDEASIIFHDGSICVPFGESIIPLHAQNKPREEQEYLEDFYPGQQLCRLAESDLLKATFSKGTFRPEHCDEYPLVFNVIPKSISVDWNVYNSFKEIVKLKTIVTVHWQDGSISPDIDAIRLYPCQNLDSHDLWPNDYIVKAETSKEENENSPTGVVVNVDSKSRTAKQEVEDLSLYEIAIHPTFQFELGDLVVLTEDSKEKLQLSDRDWVGEVIGFHSDGMVDVFLMLTKKRTKISPKRLLTFDDGDPLYSDEDDDGETEGEQKCGDSEDEEHSEWETEDELEEDDGLEVPANAEDTGLDPKYSTPEEFVPFKICDAAPTGHHYYNSITVFTKSLTNRIRKELSILSTSLPSGILVRGFEDRLDLLRVLIGGPSGTPFEMGLFLFDLRLPSEFPRIPPGLVLNRNPYYNEAGYDKQLGTEEGAVNSNIYTEKSFLLTLRSVLHIVKHPPEPFQTEVSKFYINQAKLHELYQRCQQLDDGDQAQLQADNFPLLVVSAGCKKIMKGLQSKIQEIIGSNKVS
ncbi:E2/E3 hybrid ubiquitin-protein ligase ube2o [Phlyctochytrium planicorne]|nr:E2/E3 hybrid ubiquitin-protein ligase ube2o [Phlyctochytrium planicorne]